MKLRAYACGLLLVLLAPTLHADETHEDTCFDAAVAGQKARKAGELATARAAFLRCAQAACPAEVTARCVDWAAEVDGAMPSVLVAAQDEHGRDMLTGTIRIDGTSHPEALSGQAVPLEPGAHVLRLEITGRAPVEQSIVTREHEKNRRVVLRIAATPKRPSIVPFVLGAIGGAAALSFGAFATVGLIDRHSSHCDIGCGTSDANRVRAEFWAADISLATSGTFVVAAIVSYIISRVTP